MTKLVLLRHGESQWNLENRFTGWIDVDLSENGLKEAKAAGKLVKEIGAKVAGFAFIIELTELNGSKELNKYKTVSLVKY